MDQDGPTRRRVLGATGAALASALAGCGSGDGGGDGGAEADVTVDVGPDGDLRFAPETAEVAVGETVEWAWQSSTHTVTPDSIPEAAEWAGEPGIYHDGHTYAHTFEAAGTYEYYCEPHLGAGMVGDVVVGGDGGGGNSSE